ncbi:MAG TPA: hypothetical protein PK523_02385 [Elusimicrobiales bacterium]|nr:hypothetical protein [Elusimicrobiales bacterium]
MTDKTGMKDSYLEGRRLEAAARSENSPSAWLEFAGLKAAKGSYALSALGYLNAGMLLEAAGDKSAAESYADGFGICVKGKLREPALFLVSRLAALLERRGDTAGAAAAYERLSSFCEESGAWFLAADAAEHAAEMMRAGGRDISGYSRPAELWERNAEYWKDRDAGDEAWSRRRADLYRESLEK